MSNTRKAKPGTQFRQERYASSAEFHRGLMANLVAARASLLENEEDRDLVWSLQQLSHAPGGLKKLAESLLANFSDKLGTREMRQLGCKPGQRYSADQVQSVRCKGMKGEYMTQGEWDHDDMVSLMAEPSEKWRRAEYWKQVGAIKQYPSSYPADVFLKECTDAAAENLERDLAELCLSPRPLNEHGAWYFHEMISCLREHLTEISTQAAGPAVTVIGTRINETLDYALQSKCMVVVDGLARTGKTFAAKEWCAMHPGRARYVQVPSTNDDIGFYRAIAKPIGVSININSKAQELRQRIEDALQAGHLFIVFDEAHYLWPSTNLRDALPVRINWIMTALVNMRVPVALITTPQFMRTQKLIEKRSHWTSEQFIGRIGHYEKLPDTLSAQDLGRVALALLPEGDSKTIELLSCYAQASAKYLAGIEAVVRRARYLAGTAGRKTVSREDIKRAIQGSVMPSDSALAKELAEPDPRAVTRKKTAFIPSCRPSETAIQTRKADLPVRQEMSPTGATEDFLDGAGNRRRAIELTGELQPG